MKLEDFTQKMKTMQTGGTGKPAREEIDGHMERETTKLRDEAKMAREICFRHAQATRETEMLREELIKGTANGEEWEALFFKAVKIVGLATGDTGFLPIIEGASRRRTENKQDNVMT